MQYLNGIRVEGGRNLLKSDENPFIDLSSSIRNCRRACTSLLREYFSRSLERRCVKRKGSTMGIEDGPESFIQSETRRGQAESGNVCTVCRKRLASIEQRCRWPISRTNGGAWVIVRDRNRGEMKKEEKKKKRRGKRRGKKEKRYGIERIAYACT